MYIWLIHYNFFNQQASSSFEPVVTINYDQNTEYKSEYNEPESWSESNQSEIEMKDTVKIDP